MKHILKVIDLKPEELEAIITRSAYAKKRYHAGSVGTIYAGRTLAMYFEKPSLRTKVALEVAMHSMGGGAVSIESSSPGAIWQRECIKDQAKVMSRYASLIAIRTFSQDIIEEYAKESSVPVINVLSDYSHPTQALADFLTIYEYFGSFKDRTIVFLGDGNNVARSLLAASSLAGVRFIWSGPRGYEIDRDFINSVVNKNPNVSFSEEYDPFEACREADIIYTDVWTSMGQESEQEERNKLFLPYQLNQSLLNISPKSSKVMHCLPANRGYEITDEVIDSNRSIVYDQAENRMHLYRGLFNLLATDWV